MKLNRTRILHERIENGSAQLQRMICGVADESAMFKAGDFAEANAGMPNEITGHLVHMRRMSDAHFRFSQMSQQRPLSTGSCDARIAQAKCNASKTQTCVRSKVRIAGVRRNAVSMRKAPHLVK
jgi:hypothetical protein